MYGLVLHHPQVLQSQISNDCLKVSVGGQTEELFFTIFLLQVSLRELHKIMVNLPEEGDPKGIQTKKRISSLAILLYKK